MISKLVYLLSALMTGTTILIMLLQLGLHQVLIGIVITVSVQIVYKLLIKEALNAQISQQSRATRKRSRRS